LTSWKKALIVLAAVLGHVAAGQTGVKADADPAAQEETKKLEADLGAMIVHGQWDQYAARLTDDYVRTAGNGVTQNRSETLADLRAEKTKVLDVMAEELKVAIYGNAAVCTGHRTELLRENGRVTTVFTRFTDTFVRRDGPWMLAASQETRVKQ